MAEWHYLLEELAHRRRFFATARGHSSIRLFEGVTGLKFFDKDTDEWLHVVNDLPAGTDALPCARAQLRFSATDVRRSAVAGTGVPAS